MSAGEGSAVPRVSRDLSLLAPKFREAVEAALEDCKKAGFDAFVFEAYRSNELQELYYQRGRTVIPPNHTVTNAKTNLYSWHGYGLAVDVVSESKLWDPPGGEQWFAKIAEIFKAHACSWGGDWTKPDTPHFQWGRCKPSPSELARLIMSQDGREAVWDAVGANAGSLFAESREAMP
jgi:peptidoglycan L-alanyl-D-glutamate endopeptidase CwlK